MVQDRKRVWSLQDLEARFPGVLQPGAEPNGRCTHRHVGTGKYIKQSAVGGEFAHVTLEATPAPAFTIRLAHYWAQSVAATDVEELDAALLEGLVQSMGRLEAPLRVCELTASLVEQRGSRATPTAMRVAAAMALSDLVRNAGWNAPSAA